MARTKKSREYRPSGWQLDPNSITTESDTVQYWVGLTMVTAMMKKEEARELVRSGHAFVCTGQAISKMVDGIAI